MRQVLLPSESTLADGGVAEQAEEIGADLGGLKLFGKASTGEIDYSAAKCRNILHHGGLFPPMRKLKLYWRSAGSGALRRGVRKGMLPCRFDAGRAGWFRARALTGRAKNHMTCVMIEADWPAILPERSLEEISVSEDRSVSFRVPGCYVTIELEGGKWSDDANGIAAIQWWCRAGSRR